MGNRLYVGNLSFKTSDVSLRAFFEQSGRSVTSLNIVKDRESGRPRGFAFVDFASEADAESAIETLNGTELDGRPLKLSEARERAPAERPQRSYRDDERGGNRREWGDRRDRGGRRPKGDDEGEDW